MTAFKLYEEDQYGLYRDESPMFVRALISGLVENGILAKVKDDKYYAIYEGDDDEHLMPEISFDDVDLLRKKVATVEEFLNEQRCLFLDLFLDFSLC